MTFHSIVPLYSLLVFSLLLVILPRLCRLLRTAEHTVVPGPSNLLVVSADI